MEIDQTSLLAALPYPALILDKDLLIVSANRAAEKLFEMKLHGLAVFRVLRQPEIQACILRTRETESLEIQQVVLNLITPRTYQISASVLKGSQEILFSLLDVSAEIDAENARSTFVANVSHELRSPLTSLLGVVETLQGPARNDEKARDRFLNLMHEETQRMSRLVGDLLSLSKLESKEHVRPKDQVHIEKIIGRVQDTLEASNLIHKDRIEIETANTIPQIRGDRDELTEVFQNLIENALKYSAPETPININIHHENAENPNKQGQIHITIADKGEGIAPEHLPRLTERFYRVDKGRSREMGGTGLGLAITKHIINRHRGKMTIESEPSIGTTVKITLRV